jgi:hypothetical protein
MNSNQKTIDTKARMINCDGCDLSLEQVFPDRYEFPYQIDDGVSFEITGGYSMFFDSFSEKDNIKVNFCHDCTVKLFNLIKKTKNMSGLHPTRNVSSIRDDSTFCCEWSWKIKNDGKTIIPEGKMLND